MTPEMFIDLMNELKEINLTLKQLLSYFRPTILNSVDTMPVQSENQARSRRRKAKDAIAKA